MGNPARRKATNPFYSSNKSHTPPFLSYLERREVMHTKEIAKIAIIAAMYAVITILVSPLAYGPLQFRVSEIMKPLALRGRTYIIGLTLGLLLANLLSPFGGPWELIWMPLVCLSGGVITHRLKKRPFIAITFYSAWIAAGVSVVLFMVLGLPVYITLPGIFVSEIILMGIGVGLIEGLLRRSGQA